MELPLFGLLSVHLETEHILNDITLVYRAISYLVTALVLILLRY